MPSEWVLLCYRVPRVPSTPRIAVWRRLRALGVAQVGDGVVALLADARSREQLEWTAEQVEQAGGSTLLWTAVPTSAAQEEVLVAQMRAARAVEYAAVRDAAGAALLGDGGTGGAGAALRRLRAELRRVERRDWFPPPERDGARAAVRGSRPREWCNSDRVRLCCSDHAVISSGVASPSGAAGAVSSAMVVSPR